jgi:L-arabinose isomerase
VRAAPTPSSTRSTSTRSSCSWATTGPVTILGVSQTAGGRLRLLAAEGEAIAGPTFRIGNTNSRIRFAKGPAAFMDAWCAGGPTHHVALGIDHQLDRIRKVAHLLDVELAVVE